VTGCENCHGRGLDILAHHSFIGPEPEPPMTVEEEEAAPADNCTCADAGDCFTPSGHYADCPESEPEEPPQPVRRAPYAVDYSAGGHGFQVLVPGDVTVIAVDGALVLRHEGFPVLGISAITPLKETS
jgi:hypothetical protein